jgi:hypothetical protein
MNYLSAEGLPSLHEALALITSWWLGDIS